MIRAKFGKKKVPPLSHGQILAATLEGAWRAAVPPAHVSAGELASVAPLLEGSGAAPLAWWKIRRTELAVTHAAHRLRQAYLYQTLRAALQEQEIETVFALLAHAGVEALLLKGWAAARLCRSFTGRKPAHRRAAISTRRRNFISRCAR